MADDNEILTHEHLGQQLSGTGFRWESGALRGEFETPDFVGSVRFLRLVTDAAEQMNHHPDVELGYGRIAFTLSSHDVGGVTARDVRLARRIAELAGEADAESHDQE